MKWLKLQRAVRCATSVFFSSCKYPKCSYFMLFFRAFSFFLWYVWANNNFLNHVQFYGAQLFSYSLLTLFVAIFNFNHGHSFDNTILPKRTTLDNASSLFLSLSLSPVFAGVKQYFANGSIVEYIFIIWICWAGSRYATDI